MISSENMNMSKKRAEVQRRLKLSADRKANCACLSPRSFSDEKVGMKADERAPSATKLRNKFGALKATKNTSDSNPAPRPLAISRSLKKPRARLRSVSAETVSEPRRSDELGFAAETRFVLVTSKFSNPRLSRYSLLRY
jgi:hypothetical protein